MRPTFLFARASSVLFKHYLRHSTESEMRPRNDGLLVLMPTLTARQFPDGLLGLTTKFVDGVEEYLKYWNGPIRLLIEPSEQNSENLDNIRVRPDSLPFEIAIVDFTSPTLREHLRGASVVFCGASHRQNHIAALCRSLGLPCVYGAEYSLKTRMQIVESETPSLYKRVRRYAWTARQELFQRAAIRRATGVQCNGTPTYDAYRELTELPHLFFDTRTRAAAVLSEATLQARLQRFQRGGKIRLAFTGRLDRMKGTDTLPAIASALKGSGLEFELAICGDGELADSMARDIERLALGDCVSMKGVLDFKNELVPFVKEHVDLFVCTHVQGDPSCTYLETFACGVPIVGFANEAFAGLLLRTQAGWLVPMRDVASMAQKIIALDQARHIIADASRCALSFAAEHNFESTFARRIEHLRNCKAHRAHR